MPPKGRLGLLAGDLDAEHGSHFGVTCDLLGSGTQLCKESLAVDHRTVALGVSGFEEVALNNLVTAEAGAVFDAVLDQVSLFGQGCNLGQESAEGVDVVGCWGDDGSGHFAVFLWF